jgi:cell division protein FtsB
MQDEHPQAEHQQAGIDALEAMERAEAEASAAPWHRRAWAWMQRAWRPGATGVAVVLAGLLMWHVVNGKHGLSVWQKQRVEDQQLRKEIQDLDQENTRLRVRIEKLKTDPEAIEHEAREKLHYAKPGEVIVTLPDPKKTSPPAAAPGK